MFEATSEKLQEIHESVSRRITVVEERVSHLEKTVDMKVNCLENTVDEKVDNLEKAFDGKLVIMEEKINNLQSQRPKQMRVVNESTTRIKLPYFDGSSPLCVFKFQFETVASRNGWDDGAAAGILETIPTSCRNN